MGENIIPWTVGVGVARRVEQPSDVLPPMRLGELVAFVEAPPGYRGARLHTLQLDRNLDETGYQ